MTDLFLAKIYLAFMFNISIQKPPNVKFSKTIFLRTFVCYLVQIFPWKYQSKFSFLLGEGLGVEDSVRAACYGQKTCLQRPLLYSSCALLRRRKQGPALVAIVGGETKGGIVIWNPTGANILTLEIKTINKRMINQFFRWGLLKCKLTGYEICL